MRDLFARAEPAPAPAPPPSPAFKRALKAVPALLVDGHEIQRCAVCRETAHFGFGRDMKRREPGIWFCGPHRGLGA